MERNTSDKIKTFKDISKIHQIEIDTLDGINKRLAKSMGIKPEEVAFTSLQRQAFNTKGFWLADNIDNHIIVQGATSAGKTLVSELAILDTLKNNNKCIVLVPLRAMVRERWEQLKRDLEYQGNERQIYASSSDYQDHDGEIINGNYTVAVIVYEKFFTMLSQSSNKMLDDCGLLVVDELQMLGNSNRGPKLEIAIQKVLRRNEMDDSSGFCKTRIMCLTTSDCHVNFIKSWLTTQNPDKPPILIANPNRPTTLHEHVIQFDGTFKAHTILGERDLHLADENADIDEPTTGKIDIPNYERNAKPEIKKSNLLITLLRQIYSENPNARVLVFVNGRGRTRNIAERIVDSEILPKQNLSPTLERINEFDDDDYQYLFKEKLFPRRIACHNAAISTALREYVEELFSDENDPLKLVVATETLTIGMNMPVDVMILYDHEIRRSDRVQSISSQEYKNFVGRAGRLGQQNIENGGKSYIFASSNDEAQYFWNTYVNCRAEEIKSSLINSSEESQAPYYLSLINAENNNDNGYSADTLGVLWQESFSNSCNGRRIDMKKLCKALKTAHLCTTIDIDDEDEDEDQIRYSLTDFGKGMVPYAFSLDTCKKLNRYFFNGGYVREKGNWKFIPGKGGLPQNITDKELNNNMYLLDILYILCSTREVRQMGQITLPIAANNPDRSRRAMDSVENTLKRIINNGEYKPWAGSPLLDMVKDGYVWSNEHQDKEALMRAIIIWHWTKGARIEQIRKETNFPHVQLVAGDIARIAETIAYQIESIYHCIGYYHGYIKFGNLKPSSIYRLSTRVNYGVPQNLVNIANRHVHALDRKAILGLGELYECYSDDYPDIRQWLRSAKGNVLDEISKILTDDEREQILQSIDDSNTRDNFDQLLEEIKKDSMGFDDVGCDALKIIHDARSTEEDGILKELNTVFKADAESEGIGRKFRDIELDFPLRDDNFALIKFGDKSFYLIIDNNNIADKIDEYIYQINKNKGEYRIILLTFENSKLSELEIRSDCKLKLKDIDISKLNLKNIDDSSVDLAMTLGTFSGLIAQAIKLVDINALAELLWDTRGSFDKPLSSFNSLLRNYLPEQHSTQTAGTATVRILYDKRKTAASRELLNVLEENQIAYSELTWGTELNNETDFDTPTLIFLRRSARQSHCSLDKFCKGLARTQYRKVYAIFESEDEFLNWGGDPEAPCEALEHCNSTRNLPEDMLKFKILLQSWEKSKYLIGVSYAHEKDMDADRAGVKLLKKFIEIVQSHIPEAVVLFDQNPKARHLFNGNNAQRVTLEKYSQCEYFVVLDDGYYDRSENCVAEGDVIRSTLDNMPNSDRRLWLLQPKNAKHCSIWREGDYSTTLTKDRVEGIAYDFVQMIRDQIK